LNPALRLSEWLTVIEKFKESLPDSAKDDDGADQYLGEHISGTILSEMIWLMLLGLSLREMIHDFKYQTLVLFKCCLLQPKVRTYAFMQSLSANPVISDAFLCLKM
jgi:hypothetical protein